MNIPMPGIIVTGLISVGIFIWMKKKQADRHDDRIERLRQKQEDLMELLQKNKSESEKTETDEN
ncbi:MAG: hypothetical protein ABJA78_11375 [Ferruginibacter sp.]